MPLSTTGKITITIVLSPPGLEPTDNTKDCIMDRLAETLHNFIEDGVEYIQFEYESMKVM